MTQQVQYNMAVCPVKVRPISVQDIEYWTDECLIDELFLQLASITYAAISDKGHTITVHKYYHQASVLRKYISVGKPTPSFVVHLSDLTPEIIMQLGIVGNAEDAQLVLKRAVGRIFENLCPELYNLSIAKVLQVRLIK